MTGTSPTRRQMPLAWAGAAAAASAPRRSSDRVLLGEGQLLELLGAVSLGGWRREATEEEEGGRQGRQLGVRGHRCLHRVLPVLPPRLPSPFPAPSSPAHPWAATEVFSWCFLLLVARLGTAFAVSPP